VTWYERFYCALWPVTAVHHARVRRLLRERCPVNAPPRRLLDVGGRKSQYTIGVNAQVEIVDLPRESEVQKALSLGLTETILAELKRRRSNVAGIRLEDITRTTYETETFDIVVSVEVIEHVPDDSAFVSQIHRILKSNGWFILTTPNGQTTPNVNPDHMRHYTADQLEAKLREAFSEVKVFTGVRQGFVHDHAIRGWIPHKSDPWSWLRMPWRMGVSLLANLLEGTKPVPDDEACHLFAIARKTTPPRQEGAGDAPQNA